jgi:homoserine acetyltransferase
MPERDYELFALGDFTLQMGATLRDAQLDYQTYGTLTDDKGAPVAPAASG